LLKMLPNLITFKRLADVTILGNIYGVMLL